MESYRNVEVTVCVITYKHENYIEKCLDSIFSQKTDFNFQVVVGEDASPDGTRTILLKYKEKYGDRLILVLHDKNVGPSQNSRSLCPYCVGKYIAVCEGDDFWVDDRKLQKQYDLLENNPQYSAVCCDFMLVYPDGSIARKNQLRLKKDEVKTLKDFLSEGYTLHTCTIFRRNIFPYDDEKYVKLRTAEPTMGDIITFTLLYTSGDIYVLKDVMSAHRLAGEKDVSSYSEKQKNQALYYTKMFIRIIRNLESYCDNKYDFSPLICMRIASVKLDKIMGNYTYSRHEMKEIVKELPLRNRVAILGKMIKKCCKMILRKIKAGCRK